MSSEGTHGMIALSVAVERLSVFRPDRPLPKIFVRQVCAKVEENGVGYDIGSHREASPGIRIWGAPTVGTADIEKLLLSGLGVLRNGCRISYEFVSGAAWGKTRFRKIVRQ